MPHVFERDGRAPSETVEAFVEFLEPRQTCGAVDVASGQGPWARRPWARRPVGAPPVHCSPAPVGQAGAAVAGPVQRSPGPRTLGPGPVSSGQRIWLFNGPRSLVKGECSELGRFVMPHASWLLRDNAD